MVRDKRVAVFQIHKTLNHIGGILTFLENLFDSLPDTQFDLIMDGYDENCKLLPRDNVSFIYSDSLTKDDKDVKMRGRFDYSTSLEMQINFRDAFLKAIKKNIYDMVLINSEEAVPAFFNVGYPLPAYVYTHFGSLIYPKESQTLYQNLHNQTKLYKDKITLLTQSVTNKTLLDRVFPSVRVCGMMLEKPILENKIKKDSYGLVFNGRVSSEKNFELFCQVAAEVDMPVYILTSNTKRSENTARLMLEQYGVKEYYIRGGLRGQEKVDFLNQGNVLFLPSKYESFSYSTYESLTTHHVVLPDREWARVFEDYGAYITSDYVKTINDVKTKPIDEKQVETIKSIHANNVNEWLSLICAEKNHESKSKKLGNLLDDRDYISVYEYFDSLGRDVVISDIDSLVRQSGEYILRHSPDETFICIRDDVDIDINNKDEQGVSQFFN